LEALLVLPDEAAQLGQADWPADPEADLRRISGEEGSRHPVSRRRESRFRG
jgi:hypothetical protein